MQWQGLGVVLAMRRYVIRIPCFLLSPLDVKTAMTCKHSMCTLSRSLPQPRTHAAIIGLKYFWLYATNITHFRTHIKTTTQLGFLIASVPCAQAFKR